MQQLRVGGLDGQMARLVKVLAQPPLQGLCNQKQSEAIRSNQKQSEAIRKYSRSRHCKACGMRRCRNQEQSDALRSNRKHLRDATLPHKLVEVVDREAELGDIGRHARHHGAEGARHLMEEGHGR